MMSEKAKKVSVESSDSTESILAAMKRIEEVGSGATLIDSISDADWKDESIFNWNINVCSRTLESADELDSIDGEVAAVA